MGVVEATLVLPAVGHKVVVEADGPLDDCSAAAAATSDVDVMSTRCNTNEGGEE